MVGSGKDPAVLPNLLYRQSCVSARCYTHQGLESSRPGNVEVGYQIKEPKHIDQRFSAEHIQADGEYEVGHDQQEGCPLMDERPYILRGCAHYLGQALAKLDHEIL